MLWLLGGIRKMFGDENCFHSEQVQVLNSTSGKPTRMMTGMYNPQVHQMPISGTGLETSTRRSGAPQAMAPFAELLFISVFFLSLLLTGLLTGCSPRMHQSNFGRPEMPPVVIISGSSTVSGDLVVDNLVGGEPTGNSPVDPVRRSENPAQAAGLTYQDRLVAFAQDPVVQDRVRHVAGWLEFGRSKVVLPRLNHGLRRISSARTSSGKLAHSEAELRDIFDQNKELVLWLTLWCELLVDPEFDTNLSAEDLSVVRLRLERAARALALAEKPEDVQEIDLLLLKE